MENQLFNFECFFSKPWLICAILFTCTSFDTHGKYLNSFAGPWISYVTKVYNCEVSQPEKISWNWYARVSHFKPTRPLDPQHFTGNLTGAEIFNDSAWARVVIDQRNNNQWKENAMLFRIPTMSCTALFKNVIHAKELVGKLYREKPCAVLPGVNIFNDLPLKVEHPNIPVLPYGEFRLRAMSNYVGLSYPAACLAAEYTIVPRT